MLHFLVKYLQGPVMVFFLLSGACITSLWKRKTPPGIIFFTFASMLCLLGIVSSQLLFYSFVNTVTISLLCLYFVMLIALQTGVVADILEVIYRFSRGRSLRFYLLLTAFASFFPSRRMEREILGFLKRKKAEASQSMHLLFPVLFVLASSLTLLGSATNMVSDHISAKILHGSRWGFFTYGPISISLFVISFGFFFALMRLESQKGALLALATSPSVVNSSVAMKDSMSRIDVSYNESAQSIPLKGNAIRKSKGSEASHPSKMAIKIVLAAMAVLSLFGLQLICISPLCAVALLFVKGVSSKSIIKRLPWDLLLLIVSAFIFTHGFVQTDAFHILKKMLSHIHGSLGAMTFFLFTSGLLSLFMPSIMVVAVLLPLAISPLSAFSSSLYLLNIITVGSFFIFPRRSLVCFDKTKDSAQEKLTLMKIQGVWVLVVYLVFCVHTLFA